MKCRVTGKNFDQRYPLMIQVALDALKAAKCVVILAVEKQIFPSPLPSDYGLWRLYVGSYVGLHQSVLSSIIDYRMSFSTDIKGEVRGLATTRMKF